MPGKRQPGAGNLPPHREPPAAQDVYKRQLEIYPAYWSGRAIRVEFFGDEVDRISEINAVSGIAERYVDHVAIYPASHYVASKEKLQRAMVEIQRECDDQVAFFRAHDKLIEAQRIAQDVYKRQGQGDALKCGQPLLVKQLL